MQTPKAMAPAVLFCALVGVVSSSGCGPQYVDPTALPGVAEARPGEKVDMPRIQDPTEFPDTGNPEVSMAAVADKASTSGGSGSVGCLPLVTYDWRASGPTVSELGVQIADAIGEKIQAKSYPGEVLSTLDMAVRLSEMNVERQSLSSLTSIMSQGAKLGVDKIVFGTIRHERDVGRSGREVLEVNLFAYDVLGGRLIVEERLGIPSDRHENSRYFTASQRASTWEPGDAYNVPEVGTSLEGEMRVVAGILARRVVRLVDFSTVSGIVYIPPTDTAPLSQSVARLRSAQKAFAAEYTRRQDQAQQSGTVPSSAGQVVLNDVSFPDLQAAGAHLEKLREELLTADNARFSQQISSQYAEALIPLLSKNEVKVLEIGFTNWSDTQLVEAELATGGLATSRVARNALKVVGVELVIAPRFERFGQNYLLCVDIYDLKSKSLTAATYFPISPQFDAELRSEIGG